MLYKQEKSGGLITDAVERPASRVRIAERKDGMARTISYEGYTIQSTPYETEGG